MADDRNALWVQLMADLSAWHTHGDRGAARAAVSFLEPELRLAIPPLVRRTWPVETVEDALREFIARLLERPLSGDIREPRRYLFRAFRNSCIDLHRALQRRDETPMDAIPGWEPTQETPDVEAALERRAEATRVRVALDALPVADRVALKLVDAPEWLDSGELGWLADRSGLPPAQMATRVEKSRDVFALTELFDPRVPGEPDDRRKRMERFRRRRARARAKLRAILEQQRTDS